MEEMKKINVEVKDIKYRILIEGRNSLKFIKLRRI
jgi:hypothetical protein